MSTAASTLYVTIDASGSQAGANTVNAQLNSIVNQSIIVNNTLIQMGNTSQRTTDRMGSGFSSLSRYFRSFSKDLSSISGMIAAFQPVNMFRSYIDELIDVNREYSSFIAMMNVTTDDLGKSKDAYDYVKGAAMAYGVQIKGLMKGYSQLSAATKGLMSELDNKRLFESVAAVTTVMHSTPQTVERIYNSLIQMASKGKVSMEELRQQFGEHVPGALQIGANAMGMTIKDFIQQVTKGGMSASEFLTRLPDELFKRFGDAAEIASKSLNATLERLKTTVFDVFKDMSTNGAALGIGALFDAISTKIRDNTPAFVTFSEIVGNGFLRMAEFINNLKPEDVQSFADSVVNATKAFVDFVGMCVDAVNWLIEYGDEVKIVVELLLLFKLGIAGLVVPMMGVTTQLLAAGGATAAVGLGLGALTTVLGVLVAAAAGWQFGTYLSEKFEIVELAGQKFASVMVRSAAWIGERFDWLAAAIPYGLSKAFEESVNLINRFMTSVANLGVDAAKLLGFDVTEFKPIQLDFSSGYKREFDKVVADHAAATKRFDKIDEEMVADIKARHAKTAAELSKTTSVADQLGLSPERMFRIKERMLELQTGNTPYDPKSDPMNKGGNGKNKKGPASTLVQDTMDQVNQLKESYSSLSEKLKTAIEDDTLTINQAYEAQVSALKSYTETEKALIQDAIKTSKNPKEREDLNNKLFKIEEDYQQALTKLNRENIKERQKDQEAANKALIDAGISGLTKVQQYIAEWNQKEGKQAENAKSGGDIATYDKFIAARQETIRKMNEENKKAVDTFFATEDEKWLMDVTEKYEKVRKIIQDSGAYTIEQQAELIKKLDSQMEYMTPTINRIESVVTGSFGKMADALATFVRTGKADFGSLIQSMIADMVKLELQAGMSSIWKSMGGLSGIFGGAGDLFGGIESGGGIMDAFSSIGNALSGGAATVSGVASTTEYVSGMRALGGPVLAGRTYIVGENGPERFTPSSSGNITPSAPVSNTFNIHLPAGTPAETRRAAGAGARDALKAFNAAGRYN